MTEHQRIEGFEIGANLSDGETLCTGCWDESEWDVNAANNIPAGDPVYFRLVSIACDEYDAYCQKCAEKRAAETY